MRDKIGDSWREKQDKPLTKAALIETLNNKIPVSQVVNYSPKKPYYIDYLHARADMIIAYCRKHKC